MIIKRLVILQSVLLLGMGTIFLLPKRTSLQPTGVVLSLPSEIDGYYGRDEAVTPKELEALGTDTEFARKTYTDLEGNRIFVSVVLAGQDMNTGIHRPERCLPAQGLTIADSRAVNVALNMPQQTVIPTTRLHIMRPSQLANGQAVNFFGFDYYWFVGLDDITNSHTHRNLIDWRDRLLKGYNQRWAFVTVIAMINGNSKEAEDATDKTIQKFIADLFPKIWKSAGAKG
jgi:EpsI family protein